MFRHLCPWWTRRVRTPRKGPPPRLEPLEDRLVLAGNILVSTTLGDTTPLPQVLREYTSDGTLVSEKTVPDDGNTSISEHPRDIIVAPDGKIHIYNGTFTPVLTIYDPSTDTFSNRTYPNWNTSGTESDGGIAVFKDYVFVTDEKIAGDSETDVGIVRFNLADDSATRFAQPNQPIDLTIGLDGKLYALDAYDQIFVYDPTTLALERQIQLPFIIGDDFQDYRGIAVNARGEIFTATWGGDVHRLDQAGVVQATVTLGGNLADIDVSTDGELVIGQRFGQVFQVNEDFTNSTSFSTDSNLNFVAFADPQLPTPSLRIDDVSVTEGDAGKKAATFTVQLSFDPQQTVTVDYATADGTATAGSDYQSTSGTLTFDPGQTSKTVSVLVFGDTVFEPNETFTVTLSQPVNAIIRDGSDTGTGTILNDDLPPEFINEILLDSPGSDAPNQYVEIRDKANQTIADGTYLVAVEGDGSGDVQAIIDLSGLSLGSSGYLLLLQASNSYSVAGGTTVLTGTTTGFGGLPGNRFSADDGTDLPGSSESFLLIQTTTAPALTDDIDANDDGTPDGTVYAGWTLLDSIGILDGDAGDHAYAALTFRNGSAGVATGTVATVGFTAGYVARNGDSTGSTEADWVAGGDLKGTAPNFTLDDSETPSTDPVLYAGKSLDSFGTTNFPNLAPVNTVPDAQTTNEDTALVFSAQSSNLIAVADPDAGTAAVRTRVTVTNGILTLANTANLGVLGNGTADVTITGPITAINAALDGLRFDPTPNFNGTATLQVVTDDQGNIGSGGARTDTDTVSITVKPVNDAPSFTLSGDVTVNEDAGAKTVAGFAGNIAAGPANEAGQHLTFSLVTHVTSGDLAFTSGPAINASTGALTFTTAADTNGTATIEVTLTDDGGTDDGGIDTSSTRTFTLTVRAVNDAPLFDLAGNVTVDEDAGAQTMTGFATNFRPGPASATDEAGQALVRYDVTILSTTGGLTFASAPSIDTNGTLSFQSATNAFGTATVRVTAIDSGPGTSPDVNSGSKTFTLMVNPVNDAPSFTLSGDVTVNEDAGAKPVPGVAGNIAAGPANEAGQHLTFSLVTHVTSGSLAFTSDPAINASTGVLSFTTAADTNGTATVEVTLSDDGGTGDGGIDTSPTRTFTLTVRPVNDAPLFNLAGNVTVNEDAGPQTMAGFATNFRPGPASATDETGQTLIRYDVTVLGTTGPLTFTAPPAVSTNGILTFTAAANAFGTATVRVAAIDSGPSTPPDVNTGTRTFTLAVNPVNDPPTANDDAVGVVQNRTTLLNVLANDSIAPDLGESLTIVSTTQGSAGGSVVIDGGTGIRYKPAHNFLGVETFTYTVADGNGGHDTATVTVTVRELPPGTTVVVTGADAGSSPHVIVRDALSGAVRQSFPAYGAGFQGGVRVASGDVTGDGIADIVTGTGPGAPPHIKVFDGVSGAEVYSFLAYGPGFVGGVYVAAGDVNGDGFADIITGSDAGVPAHVKVFSGRTLQELYSFRPYDGFPGGVRVAAGDVNGDGFADIITGAGPGAGPHIKAFSGQNGAEILSVMAFGSSYAGGVFVAAGDVDGDGFAEIIAGAGTVAHVRVLDGRTGTERASFMTHDGLSGTSLVTFDASVSRGVRVASADLDGDGLADILTATGPGRPAVVRKFQGTTLAELDNFFAYGSAFLGGLFIGGN